MKSNKFSDIVKISLIPFLIYLNIYSIQIKSIYSTEIGIISNIVFATMLILITLIILKEGLLHKILSKYNKQITGLTVFLTYFVYMDILSSVVLLIFSVLTIHIDEISNFTRQIINIEISTTYLIFIILIYKEELINCFKRIKNEYRNYLEVGIPTYIVGLFLMITFNLIFQVVFNIPGPKNEDKINEMVNTMPIYVFFAASIFAPIVEEMIFRKTFRDIYKNTIFYIIFSGFIFGFLHIASTFSSITDLVYVLPYGVLGAGFAYMYHKTKNILVPISFHLIHNTTLMIIQMLVIR